MRDIDPKYVKYNGNNEYGYGPDGRIYNRDGGETAESKRIHNIRAQKKAEENARREAERQASEERKKSNRQSYSTGSSYSGPSFSLGGIFSGIAGLFGGLLALDAIGILLIPLFGVIFAIIYYVREYAGKVGDILESIGFFLSDLWEILITPITAWPYLLQEMSDSLLNPLKVLFAIGIIFYTIKKFRDESFFMDVPYTAAIIGFVVLEVIHHFFGGYGLIFSVYYGICLSLPVLIILYAIDRFNNR